jgi:hypothetical protein
MNNITDQYHGDPTYAELYVLARTRPLVREMLKTASFNKEGVEDLPSSVFAWEAERRFPVHTKEDTIASVLYRSKLGSDVPKYVDEKLAKAVEIHQIDEHIFATTKLAATTEPVYALPEDKRLPLNNPGQIKVAEHVLLRDFERLPLEKRADTFSRLAIAARKHEIELQPLTQKMAGMTISNTATLRKWLEARATVTQEKISAAFDTLADGLANAPEHIQDRTSLVKLASTIDQLDRKAGLNKYYDRKLPDPLQTVFNTEKIAMEMVDVAGMQVPVETLMQLPPEIWEQVDAPELAELAQAGDPVTFKQVFDTMPLDIKVVLQGQLG